MIKPKVFKNAIIVGHMIISKKGFRLSLSKREINLILKYIVDREQVCSVFLYGSQLTKNVSKNSDVDLLIILKDLNFNYLEKLKIKKTELEKLLNLEVSLNIHTIDEINPLHQKKGLFIHKNRSELFIYKYKYQYKLLYGYNPFSKFRDPSPKEVRVETIKLLSSFSYFLKKFVYNSQLAPHKEKEFIRTPLICLEYVSAFFGYLSFDKVDAFSFLKKNKLLTNEEICMINSLFESEYSMKYLKKKGIDEISIIKLIDEIKLRLIKKMLVYANSDIRLVDGHIKQHWDLKYPQAVCMGLLINDKKILLLQRTDDDYLYPKKWTIVGGYLKQNENPYQSIVRETLEETGLTEFKITSLFGGKPMLSPRVAAFCFTIQSNQKINVREHSNFKWVTLKDALEMDLTPETKKILQTYSNL